MQKLEELEKTKKDSIELAGYIFKVVTDPKLLDLTSPQERHEICVKRYDLFSKVYPLVLAKMAVESRYNEKAFIKFLNKLYSKPGAGMEGIIQNQAYYAKVLYIEECISTNKRWCPKVASEIYTHEYANMIRWVNDTKKIEKKVKHEFEEEGKRHDDELRSEFKTWYMNARKDFVFDNKDEILNIKELIKKDDIDIDSIKTNEIIVNESEINEDDIERQNRIDMANANRMIKEQQDIDNEWVSNPVISNWKKKHNIINK